MGVYYFLLNDTKKQKVQLCGHVKYGPMTENGAVHYSMMNYLMDNQGDTVRVISDASGNDEMYEYTNIDLLTYKFNDPDVTAEIINQLNAIYECEKYQVIDGVGEEVP